MLIETSGSRVSVSNSWLWVADVSQPATLLVAKTLKGKKEGMVAKVLTLWVRESDALLPTASTAWAANVSRSKKESSVANVLALWIRAFNESKPPKTPSRTSVPKVGRKTC